MVRIGRKNSKYYSKASFNVGGNDNDYSPTVIQDINSVPG